MAIDSLKQLIVDRPNVQKAYTANPQQVEDDYNILLHFAPTLVVVPAIAAYWVTMIGGNYHPNTIKALCEAELAARQVRKTTGYMANAGKGMGD